MTHTAAEHATQLALVAAGLGAAVIPRLGRERLPRGVRIVHLKPTLRRRVYAVWRTDSSRQRAIRALSTRFSTLDMRDVTIGLAVLRGRCAMTTYDPDTIEQDPTVLRDIVRPFGGRLCLNARAVRPGTIEEGEAVELLTPDGQNEFLSG